jgi:cobalt-zinc-cadmium efflux system outer membrane protein
MDRTACLATVALVVAFGIASPLLSQEPTAPKWTLSQALDLAFTRSPSLFADRQAVEEVRAGLVDAGTYPHNPEISLEAADRSGPDGSSTDRGISLTQEIEIAGRRPRRMAVAGARVAAAEALFSRRRCFLAYQVEAAFADAVRARELLAIAKADAALAREMRGYAVRRLERGAGTQIEVNLAQAGAGRSERRVEQARAESMAARGRLAEVVGVPPANPPEPAGSLPAIGGEPPPLPELLALARAQRADLQSLERLGEAAEAEIRLALTERRPRLTVAAFAEREERSDDLIGATVSLSVPLFNRGQGRIAESRASRTRLAYEREALGLAVEKEVTTALARLRAARNAAHQLEDQVVGTLEDNVDLLQRSFAAGRIGAAEVLTLRREFVAARQEYVETLADAWRARLELELATGCIAPPQLRAAKEQP